MIRFAFVFALFASISIFAWEAPTVPGLDDLNPVLELDLKSKYVWRGQEVNHEPVAQWNLSLSHDGVYAGVWVNQDLTSRHGRRHTASELNFVLGYQFDAHEKVAVDVGVTHYRFPSKAYSHTTEAHVAATYDTLLQPTLGAHYDFRANGTYLRLSVNHGWNLNERLRLSAETGAAWASRNYRNASYGRNASGLADWSTHLGVSYKVTEDFSFRAGLEYSVLLDSKIRAGTNSENVAVGVGATYQF